MKSGSGVSILLRRILRRLAPLLCLIVVTSQAVTISENFSSQPTNHNWRVYGDTNLFRWNSTNQNLDVTWDSSKTNSYFHYFFGTVLTRDDDFSLAFDMRLQDVTSGSTPGKPYDFPLAIGFMNFGFATNLNFSRGSGINSTYGVKSLVEFDYFPAFQIYDPTLAQIIVSTNNASWLYNHNNLLEMTLGDLFHITMSFVGSTRKLTTSITRNGTQYGATQFLTVTTNMDFRLDALSISSYSDQNGSGSILGHGSIDNIVLTVPPSPVQNLRGYFTNAQWRVEFNSITNWSYILERTPNLQSWSEVSVRTNGTGSKITLPENSSANSPQFYRVKAGRN